MIVNPEDSFNIHIKEQEILHLHIIFDLEYDPDLFMDPLVRDTSRNFKYRNISHIKKGLKRKMTNITNSEYDLEYTIWLLCNVYNIPFDPSIFNSPVIGIFCSFERGVTEATMKEKIRSRYSRKEANAIVDLFMIERI